MGRQTDMPSGTLLIRNADLLCTMNPADAPDHAAATMSAPRSVVAACSPVTG